MKFLNDKLRNDRMMRSIMICLVSLAVVIFPVIAIKAEDGGNYVFSAKEDAIYSTLIDSGYSVAGACGILGNISVENPKFEPDLYANNGYTYGLFQWSDTGNRKSFLTRWCNNRLLYPNRMEGQLAYAMYELNGGDSQASRVNDYLKISNDPEMAAMEFAVGFERCIGSTGNDEADGVYCGEVYPEHTGDTYQALARRMANARKYYDGYSVYGSKEEALDVSGTITAGIVAEKEDEMEEELLTILPEAGNNSSALKWAFRILAIIIGYLLGNIEGVSVIIRNVRAKQRLKMDKKLPSLMAVLKYVGVKEAFLAALIDIAKFYAALMVVYLISKGALGPEQILWTGLGVILGNDYPFWHGFNGGMGIMVTIVFLCTYMPIWGYECVLLGLLVAVLTKSLPVGALSITLFAVPYGFFCRGFEAGVFILAALILLLFRHYCFIKRFISRDILHRHYTRKRIHGVRAA